MNRENHGLINYKDKRVICRHLRKLTCKGTLLEVFIRVKLENGDTVQSVILVFSTQLCELLPI